MYTFRCTDAKTGTLWLVRVIADLPHAVLALAAFCIAIRARSVETSTIVPTPPPAQVLADRMKFGDHTPPEERR